MNLLKYDIAKNNLALSKKIKKMLAQKIVNLTHLDIDEAAYASPFLYTYFNHTEEAKAVKIVPYFIGYKSKEIFNFIETTTNSEGVAYFANIGYFLTDFKKTKILLSRHKEGNFRLTLRGRTDLEAFDFKTLLMIEGTNIEILRYTNALVEIIAQSDSSNNVKKIKLKSPTKISSVSKDIKEALSVIKGISLATYNQVIENIRLIVLFNASSGRNFSAIEYSGAIFLDPPKSFSQIWLIDSLIHESSHVNLNIALVDFEKYFSIDPYERVFASPFRKKADKRGLYHIVHALYVIANLAVFYDSFFQQSTNKDKNYPEILGRLLMNIKFLGEGIGEIDFKPFFTKKGLKLLNYFKDTHVHLSTKYKDLISSYSIPNDSDNHIFSLKQFKEVNELA